MNNEIIKRCERAHYFMQLSSYFSELKDLPGVSFAYTELVSDTWYNQAYNIHNVSNSKSKELETYMEDILQKSSAFFNNHNRETCFYLTPATTPANFDVFLQSKGFAKFDEEAWMFFDFSQNISVKSDSNITIKDVENNNLQLFGQIYQKTLPGPEVEGYIKCVKNGFLSQPPLVDIKYFMAFYNNIPVGMLSLLSFEKYSGLYAVAVDEDYQNKGICKALVSAAVDACKKRGTEYLFLQTGNGESSQQAFEHMNFRTEFIRTGYIKESVLNNIQHGWKRGMLYER